MVAAWFLATGSSLSLSEQQLVDCSWDSGEYGNNGCGGKREKGTMEDGMEDGKKGTMDTATMDAEVRGGRGRGRSLSLINYH